MTSLYVEMYPCFQHINADRIRFMLPVWLKTHSLPLQYKHGYFPFEVFLPWRAWAEVTHYSGNNEYRQTSNISRTKFQNLMFFVSSCSCLCLIRWRTVLSQEWRCSCCNYIWMINNFIAYLGATYTRCFMAISSLSIDRRLNSRITCLTTIENTRKQSYRRLGIGQQSDRQLCHCSEGVFYG